MKDDGAVQEMIGSNPRNFVDYFLKEKMRTKGIPIKISIGNYEFSGVFLCCSLNHIRGNNYISHAIMTETCLDKQICMMN